MTVSARVPTILCCVLFLVPVMLLNAQDSLQVGADEAELQHGEGTEPPAWLIEQAKENEADWEKYRRAFEKQFQVDIEKMPLSEVADYFSRNTGLPFLLDKEELAKAGWDDDLPISITLPRSEVSLILDAILAKYRLGYTLRDGAIVITNEKAATQGLIKRIYDVSWISTAIQREELEVAILRGSKPEAWQVNGGLGTLRRIGPYFVVNTSLGMHLEIQDLLGKLAISKLKTPKIDAVPSKERLDQEVGSSESGKVPAWLMAEGIRELRFRERMRKVMSTRMELSVAGEPLEDVIQRIAKETETNFLIDVTELDLLALPPDLPITFRAPDARVEDILTLILNPLDLTYKIEHYAVVITSRDAADAEPQNRVYDLSWIVDDAAKGGQLLNALRNAVDPDSWVEFGGTSTLNLVGSAMVASAPESTQRGIERLLADLAMQRIQRREVEK